MKKKISNLRRKKGFIDLCVLLIVSMMVLAFALAFMPVFTTKLSLDTYANELARTAEIAGQIGAETDSRLAKLNGIKNLNPMVSWNKTGRFQMGTDAVVTVSKSVDTGFYIFGSNVIELKSTAVATSEVFWK